MQTLTRRSIFSLLSSAPAAALAKTPSKESDPNKDRFLYNGWSICWTGWKQATNHPYFVGQWIAYVPGGKITSAAGVKWVFVGIVSDTGGSCNYFLNGDIFSTDIDIKHGGMLLTPQNFDKDSEKAKTMARDRLIGKIRETNLKGDLS